MGNADAFLELLEQAERADLRHLGLGDALAEFLPQVAKHFDAEFASLLVLDPDTQELRFEYGMGWDLEELSEIRLRLGEGIAGAVALGRRGSAIADVAPVPQHSKVVDQLTGHATKSLMACPLIWGDEVVGVLEVGNRFTEPAQFSPDDITQARSLSAILAAWVVWCRAEPAAAPSQAQPRRGAALPEGPLLVGTHPSIRGILDLVLRVAPTDDPVLVLGESGTGKELIARRLHHSSGRADRPLVVLNCAALSETLLESSLFGHVKGAFTDAHADHAGAFVQADGGTLFLDEIGEMSPACQAKLLRAFESGEITPVGGAEARRVDVRIVAATNRDLAEEVEEKRFRLDLYYRLRGIEITLPPLRERAEDVPLLAELFLRQACERKGKAIRGISPDVVELFATAAWPGNVRELRHAIEAMVTLTQGDTLTLNDIPPSVRRDLDRRPVGTSPGAPAVAARPTAHADDEERRAILDALNRTLYPTTGRWNIARAARELGMSRKTLEYKIRRVHGLQPPSPQSG